MNHFLNDVYYILKPLMPRTLQLIMRREVVRYQRMIYRGVWPIDKESSSKPVGWQGWPEGKRFALVLTHDVDTAKGHDRCLDLMRLETEMGFRSSFNFVPLRYTVSDDIRNTLVKQGFEVGVHGLYHDGKYYQSLDKFLERAKKINGYLKEWHAVGYRAPAMYHRLELFHYLDIEYDASTFDTDPFEPHSLGSGTIFPFYVFGNSTQNGYVELPYTLPQDFTLFVLMKEKSIDIWKKKLDWIVEQGGMALVTTHPDYIINDKQGRCAIDEYPREFYEELLDYIKTEYGGQYWHVLPKEMARFWKEQYCGKGDEEGNRNREVALDKIF